MPDTARVKTFITLFILGIGSLLNLDCGPFPHAQWFIPVTLHTPHHCTQITALLASPEILNKTGWNLCHMPPKGRAVILLYYSAGYRSCKNWKRLASGAILPAKKSPNEQITFKTSLMAQTRMGTINIPILAMHYGNIFCIPLKSSPALHRPWRGWPNHRPYAKPGFHFQYIRLEISAAMLKSIQSPRNLRLKYCPEKSNQCSITRVFSK